MTEDELLAALTPAERPGELTSDDAISVGNRVYRRCECGVWAGVDVTDIASDYARHVASAPHQAMRRRAA